MDPATLEADLKAALTQVIADETTLQSAIEAVQGVVSTPAVDPAWEAVQTALTSNGWTAPATTAPEAPETPGETPDAEDTAETPAPAV